MIDRLRILPVLIVAATVLFGFKVSGIWQGVASIEFAPSQAQTKEDDKAAQAPAGDQSADDAAALAATEQKPAANEAPQESAGDSEPKAFTSAELEVLQNLGARRKQLDALAATLATRENVLKAAERRVDQKIEALKKLEGRIEGLLKQHDGESEEQLKSLVKVYESMKPKEAARIFEELEMEILIEVTERMREQKMAAIMAKMNPAKAKELTVELATRRPLPQTGG